MAHIYSLRIEHFRGIKHLETIFGDSKFVVLIGRGDSGKTTILKAISYVLSPNWYINVCDWDFYQCDTTKPIIIEAVVKDLPEELLTQDKYGLCFGLLKNDGTIIYDFEDVIEGESHEYQKVLTIRLTVTDNLEPTWRVISGANLDIETDFYARDRAKLKMFHVADYIDNHFSYSKGSPLYSLFKQKLDDKSSPEKKIIEMVRKSYEAIKENNSFSEFDEVKQTILELARGVGLTISELSTLLEFKENAYSESNITLHSNNIPYRLHGKGSKRLLSIAIQQGLVSDGGIVLIDELEQGMEPDRSRNLTRILKQARTGQVFVTTHSRSVLAEAHANNVFLIREGEEQLIKFDAYYQDILRVKPEAFFAKRVICCEGKTEEGIIRALDDHLLEKRGFRLAVLGVVYINSKGGDNFYKHAGKLKEKGFKVCVFADNDNEDIEKQKQIAIEKGIDLVICEKGKCVETMLFNYLPWEAICSLIFDAATFKGADIVYSSIGYQDYESIKAITDQSEQKRIREVCAIKSNCGGWYKDITMGESVGKIWFDHIEEIDAECGLKREYDELMTWIGDDINII